MKICGIYSIKCNDHVYIGQSRDIKRRWRDHRGRLERGKHWNRFMQGCWNKYGRDSFFFEIVKECATEDLTQLEMFYISGVNADMNLAIPNGGETAYTWTDEARARASDAMKGKAPPSNCLQAAIAACKGKPLSPEHIANLRSAKDSVRGKPGRKHTEESKAKISVAKQNQVFSAETCAKISASKMGHAVSPESTAKRLATMKANRDLKLIRIP